MVDPLTGALAIGGVISHIAGSGRSRRLHQQALAELRAARPVGYITPEDLRAAELTKGRMAEGVQAQAVHAGDEVGRRYRARGLAGSAAEERTRGRVADDAALGIQHAGDAAEEQLANIRMGRENFEQNKALTIFNQQMGFANQEAARQQAEQGAFWNSLNEFMPTIMTNLAPTGPAGASPTSGAGAGPGNAPAPQAGYRPEQVPNLGGM